MYVATPGQNSSPRARVLPRTPLTLPGARPALGPSPLQVLFWIGAPITLAVALYLAARWFTDPHSQVCLACTWPLRPPSAPPPHCALPCPAPLLLPS